MNKLKVVEIFYSIQGEGANTGMPAIFIRLAGCNLNCWYCDTAWHKYTEMSISDIMNAIQQYPCKNIIWTGGEPTLQLTVDIVAFFSKYYQCIETNGTNPVPAGLDYISCSPKVPADILHANFEYVNEFRFPLRKGDTLPELDELPPAGNYFISPLFLGSVNERMDPDQENINYCIDYILHNPGWKLSIQLHKLLKFQ